MPLVPSANIMRVRKYSCPDASWSSVDNTVCSTESRSSRLRGWGGPAKRDTPRESPVAPMSLSPLAALQVTACLQRLQDKQFLSPIQKVILIKILLLQNKISPKKTGIVTGTMTVTEKPWTECLRCVNTVLGAESQNLRTALCKTPNGFSYLKIMPELNLTHSTLARGPPPAHAHQH